MQASDQSTESLTAEEGWRSIHSTVDGARSSMYMAGSAAILLLWGVITSVGYLSMYTVFTLAPDFAEQWPWFPGPLWGGLGLAGWIGSAFIGHRASQRLVAGAAARTAGLRVCLFWTALAACAPLIMTVAGLWTTGTWEHPVRAWIGFVALGYILFGIMTRVVIALAGIGYAAAFYVPHYLLDDAALAVSGVLSLATFGLAFAWIRKSGEW